MKKKSVFSAQQRNRWMLYCGILALISLMITEFFGRGAGTHIDGIQATLAETREATLKVLFIFIPLLGFMLGAVVGLFPYKKATYEQKYLRSSLMSIMALYGLGLVFALIGIVRRML